MPTTYCTWSDVMKRVSAEAADLRLDDDPSAKTEVLEDAAIEVNGYLQLLYDVGDLAASDWVRVKTRDIAVFFLCIRRNHPAPQSVQARYEKAIADLEKVQAGQIKLPDVTEGKANVPVLSNQRVGMSPFPRVQTVRGKSTGTQEGYTPHDDNQDQFDYSI